MKMFATEYIGGSLTRIPSGTFRAPMLQGCCFPCDSAAKKVEVLVAQSCLTLCGSMDHRLPGFFVHGILYARIMEWVVISFFRVSSWPRDWTPVPCIGRWILCHWATWEAHRNNTYKKMWDKMWSRKHFLYSTAQVLLLLCPCTWNSLLPSTLFHISRGIIGLRPNARALLESIWHGLRS